MPYFCNLQLLSFKPFAPRLRFVMNLWRCWHLHFTSLVGNTTASPFCSLSSLLTYVKELFFSKRPFFLIPWPFMPPTFWWPSCWPLSLPDPVRTLSGTVGLGLIHWPGASSPLLLITNVFKTKVALLGRKLAYMSALWWREFTGPSISFSVEERHWYSPCDVAELGWIYEWEKFAD